jgi:hypothetical protein
VRTRTSPLIPLCNVHSYEWSPSVSNVWR